MSLNVSFILPLIDPGGGEFDSSHVNKVKNKKGVESEGGWRGT